MHGGKDDGCHHIEVETCWHTHTTLNEPSDGAVFWKEV
jgi:hypothetical protein